VIILGGVATLPILAFVGLFAFFCLFVYLPQQYEAAAFARLSGSARRLAIYDAFAKQIDRHYYDQSFSGFDWPKLRREWRSKAATEPDDVALYDDVFVQVVQRFPASHVAVTAPTALIAPNATATTNPLDAACRQRGAGMGIVPIRRGKGFGLVVGEIWPASPAARAGVTPGWMATSGQWSSVRGGGQFKGVFAPLTPIQMHAFEEGSTVQVATSGLQRVEFQYSCGAPVEPFETRRLTSGALYIRFDEFQAPVLTKVETALRTAADRGVVLDLRNNSGGFVNLGLNLLLPPSKPVYFNRDSTGRHLIYTDSRTWRYRGPLVVLIGPTSASAAEVMAAALKHEHRAVIIGRRTNGSVLGARSFPLPDGGAVEIPVEDIEMLDGQRLESVGVAPDIEVFPTLADLRAGIDPALVRAEQALASGGEKRR
jgi:carboxyl-terminal processing protease